MARHGRQIRLWLLLGLLLILGAAGSAGGQQIEPAVQADEAPGAAASQGAALIQGCVRDRHGPVAGAIVRVRTTPHTAITDIQGRFRLPVAGLAAGPFSLTAWASGYYCGGPVECRAGRKDAALRLHAHHATDNPDYAWLSYRCGVGKSDRLACSKCHSREGTDLEKPLPVDEWLGDAHAQSAVNRRFFTMYEGTDVRGRRSPVTRYADVPDYGPTPLRPDASKPYYGPGYKLDFPQTAGNCAACHAPAAAVRAPYGTDPTLVRGVGAEGVACDLCHKLWSVDLDPATGLPHPNMPGVLSMEFRRPPEGAQFFAGPYDDVATGEDTYSPLQRESRLCATCHFGVFWDTLVYNSFGEWLASPYSDPERGQTCQDCHMPPTGTRHFVLPEKGGQRRDPATIASHRMPGAADEDLLRSAVTMHVTARVRGQGVVVKVAITNDGTGHHVPTDSPLRHLILLVEARDAQGNVLKQRGGPTVPSWCGEGEPRRGCYAGLPGTAFAKILEEQWTGLSPTGAYWNPTRVLSDNRIAAGATDRSTYTFAAPAEGKGTVDVKLLFRRAFKQLADEKGWSDPDVVMQHKVLRLE